MKKGKIVMTITIGISCFVLSLVMFMQFKVVNETDITSIENMREENLRAELAAWKEKYEEVEKQYSDVQVKIKEYDEKSKSDTEKAELLEEELKQLEKSLGKTDVKGEGIVITIKESNDLYINANKLLKIIKELKTAGAEAISINNQRVVNITDIAYIKDTVIKVNGQRIIAPYIIKVIGNQTYLKSAVEISGSYVDSLIKEGYDIDVEASSSVEINKYSGEINTKYIE